MAARDGERAHHARTTLCGTRGAGDHAREDHALAQDVASDKLGEAGLTRLEAQMTCYRSRVAEAVSIYDCIIVELGTVIARSVR